VEQTIRQPPPDGAAPSLDDYNRPVNETPPGGTRVDAGAALAGRARRPAAVTILAIVQLLSAAALGLIVVGLVASGSAVLEALTGDGGGAGVRPVGDTEVAAITILVGALGVAGAAAGILLLSMRQLGWTLTMLLAGLGLASSIYLWWTQGTTLTIPVMVQVVTVFYLNQRQVRVAFGISHRRASDTLEQGRG
jgi:hypothetical protein